MVPLIEQLMVISTNPRNQGIDCPLNVPVEIEFNLDLDRRFINAGVLVSNSSGLSVLCETSYNNRVLKILPVTGKWEAETTHFITLVGDDNAINGTMPPNCIRSITQSPLYGTFKLTFTTVSDSVAILKTTLVRPYSDVIVTGIPQFEVTYESTNPVTGIEVEISLDNTMSPLIWSNTFENPGPSVVFTPDVALPSDKTIYWRARAFNESSGQWSAVYNFVISANSRIATVSEFDTMPLDAGPYYTPTGESVGLTVEKLFPADGVSGLSTKLKMVYIHVGETITREDIAAGHFHITGISADGDSAKDHGDVAMDGIQLIAQPDGSTIIAIVISDLATT